MDEAAYREAEARLWSHYDVQPKEHFVRLPGMATTVRVQEVGKGAPILFIHGSPTGGSNWAALVSQLTDFRCLVLDLPSTALSEALAVTKENALAFLERIPTETLDGLGIDASHVVASSSGSTLAMHAARHAPQRYERTVHLGAPGMIDGQPLPAAEKMLLLPGMGRLLGAFRPGRRMQIGMIRSIGHAASIGAGRIPAAWWDWQDALFRHTDTYRQQLTWVGPMKGRRLGYDPTYLVGDRILSDVGPTHVIWGSEESFGTIEEAEALAVRMNGASLEIIDGAGHLPWLDFPEQVAQSVRNFLRIPA